VATLFQPTITFTITAPNHGINLSSPQSPIHLFHPSPQTALNSISTIPNSPRRQTITTQPAPALTDADDPRRSQPWYSQHRTTTAPSLYGHNHHLDAGNTEITTTSSKPLPIHKMPSHTVSSSSPPYPLPNPPHGLNSTNHHIRRALFIQTSHHSNHHLQIKITNIINPICRAAIPMPAPIQHAMPPLPSIAAKKKGKNKKGDHEMAAGMEKEEKQKTNEERRKLPTNPSSIPKPHRTRRCLPLPSMQRSPVLQEAKQKR
jgi:hypothetical protein